VGECKRWLYTKAPWLFAVEDTARDGWRRSKPIRDQASDAAAVVCPPRASTKQSD